MVNEKKIWISIKSKESEKNGTGDMPISVFPNELLSILTSECDADIYGGNEKAAFIDLAGMSDFDTIESAIIDGDEHKIKNQDDIILQKRRLQGILHIVHLEGRERKRIRNISIVHKFLVSFAKALMSEPDIIICNHSLQEVDSKIRTEIVYMLRELQKETNIPVVYVTNEDWEALRISDRILIVNNSKIEQMGSPEEVYFYPVTYYAANALEENNIFEGYVHAVSQGITEVITECGTIKSYSRNFEENDIAYLAVRPSRMKISMTPSEMVNIKGVLSDYHFVSGIYEARVILGNEQEILVNMIEKSIPIGTEVYLNWKDEEVAWIHSQENGVFSYLESLSKKLGNSLEDIKILLAHTS